MEAKRSGSQEVLASAFLRESGDLLRREDSKNALPPPSDDGSEASDAPSSLSTPNLDSFNRVRSSHRPIAISPSPSVTPLPSVDSYLSSGELPGECSASVCSVPPPSWGNIFLSGLDPAQQAVAICQVLAQLRESEDWTSMRVYLSLVGQQMMADVGDTDTQQSRVRIEAVAEEARCFVDESLDTISIASLRLWSERRNASADGYDGPYSSPRTSEDNLRTCEEGESMGSAPGDLQVPPDSVAIPSLADPTQPPIVVKRSRLLRAWQGFFSFLDSGPETAQR